MAQTRALHRDDPAVIGGYELQGRLGESPTGVVYLGRRADRGYALTLLNAQAPASFPAENLHRLSMVSPLCAAQVLEVGRAGDRPYVVSELIEGPSVLALVRAEGARGGKELDQFALRTLTALGAIHQAGTPHGNLHPGNVIYGPEGPIVVGFGVARGSRPAFSAPEQVAADEFTPAGDLFAWAATVVYVATGQAPFGDGDAAGVFHRILRAEPNLGGLSGSLRDVVAACLSKDPAARPSAQFAQQTLISGMPSAPAAGTASKQPPKRPPAPKKQRDLRVPLLAGTATLFVIGTVAGWAVLREETPPNTQTLAGTAKTTTPPSLSPSPSPSKKKTPKPAKTRQAQPRSTVTVHVPQPVRTTPTKPPRPSLEPSSSASTKPSGSVTPTPTVAEHSTSAPSPPERSSPKPSPAQLSELGPGHFTDYCVTLGWEWVEYRETPKPGAYCIKQKGKLTTYLTPSQLDAGCRWRFNQPRAVHRFKSKSNYCYV